MKKIKKHQNFEDDRQHNIIENGLRQQSFFIGK